MLELRHPILLLLLIPALWATWRASYRWGIPHERPTSRLERIGARTVPVALAILLALAAAGPEWRSPVRGQAPVVDFAVVLDGSSSMKALDDGRESRWSAARRLLKRFIAGRPDDRFSIILFSAHPVTLSPLSADHGRLRAMLDRLELDTRDDGTAIGSGLMTAVRRLGDSPARSRVILLLTDGAQNRGRVSGEEAAQEAQQQGIRIHTMLMGRPGSESLYPIDGGQYARLKVDTDPDGLRRIAALTGGEYLEADDPQGLERSLAAVDRLEKTALPVDAPSEGRPLAHYLLAAAAFFALPLAFDLARKRGRKPPLWMGT
ncbi:MAG: VWA domain-containing protein [Firmicutes bacterium]|nr:VWA domain-containing protein [Bacillota bacterium]